MNRDIVHRIDRLPNGTMVLVGRDWAADFTNGRWGLYTRDMRADTYSNVTPLNVLVSLGLLCGHCRRVYRTSYVDHNCPVLGPVVDMENPRNR